MIQLYPAIVEPTLCAVGSATSVDAAEAVEPDADGYMRRRHEMKPSVSDQPRLARERYSGTLVARLSYACQERAWLLRRLHQSQKLLEVCELGDLLDPGVADASPMAGRDRGGLTALAVLANDEVGLRAEMQRSNPAPEADIEIDLAVERLRSVFESMVSSSDDEPMPLGTAEGAVRPVGHPRSDGEVERMKSEFLSRVGHELRTPLTGIIGYAELLTQRRVAPAQMQRWHDEILRLAKRLHRIVELLEFFAAAGAGRSMLRPEPVGVRTLVDDAVRQWTDRVPGQVSRRIGRGIPEVNADPHWLGVSLGELIGNAVEFSPAGGPITVTVGAVSNEAGSGVEISVADRGQGMSAADVERAFGDFVQGDGSDTRDHGGLGLGLSLVKRVVEGLGGTVTVASRLGTGSTVSILLPGLQADTGA